jgi:hypothetical protein
MFSRNRLKILIFLLIFLGLFIWIQFRIDKSVNSNYQFSDQENRVFIRSAFLIADDQIRLTMIKDYRNRFKRMLFCLKIQFSKPIHYIYGDIEGQLVVTCNLPECIDKYSPVCTLVGHIGVIKFNYSNHIHNLTLKVGSIIVEVPIT